MAYGFCVEGLMGNQVYRAKCSQNLEHEGQLSVES